MLQATHAHEVQSAGASLLAESLRANLHLTRMALHNALLDVGEASSVQRRMGQHAVHHGQPVQAQGAVKEAHYEQVVVVGASLLQSAAGGVLL
jgi:hypothetical protein